MEPTDLTIELLKDIRDEGRRTNERIDQTNEKLVDSEIRTSTAITDSLAPFAS